MKTLFQDLRYGLRTLLKSPGFTLIAVLSLGLGIGANSAVFSLVDAVLLRPLPVEQPDRLVALTTSDNHEVYPHGLSYLDYLDYRDHTEAFSGMTAFSPIQLSISSGGESRMALGYMVSGNFFSVLGVSAALGRTFLPEEDLTPGSHPVAVIGYGLWQQRFGADPDLPGKTVMLNGHPFTVIGVAPKDFRGVEVIATPDVWVPMMMHAQAAPGSPRLLDDRESHNFRVWARLKTEVSFDEAQAAVSVQARQLEEAYPATNKGVNVNLYPQWEARFEPGTGGVLTLASAMLMAVAALVLLIACANLANLLLSKAIARRREIAIRLALGASRWRLVRQLMTEGLLLSLMGGAVAAIIALWATEALSSIRPSPDLPLSLDVRLDGRVLAFTVLVALLSVTLFALVPALQASKANLVPALKGEEIRKRRRFNLQGALVVVQVSLSLVLLIGAGLFLATLNNAEAMDLGLRKHDTLLASLDLDLHGYDKGRGEAFHRDLIQRVEGLPGVRSASLAAPVPLDFSSGVENVLIEGREITSDREETGVMVSTVGLKYFETIGTPLVEGRDFTAQDDDASTRVAIVNETMARRFWPGQTALGKRFRFNSLDGPPIEIIGVAHDGKYRQYFEDPRPYLYIPLLQDYRGGVTLVIHTEADAASLTAAVRREVASLDPSLPLFGAKTIEEHLEGRTFIGTALLTSFLGLFGLLGLTLGAIGIYGVISYSVSRRTREIGIRQALGAQPGAVMKLVIWQGMKLALMGIAMGLLAAFAVTRFLSSFLFGVSATDPLTFAVITLLLAAVAFLACFIPARRAMKVDPMKALRYE
ncbi:MAG: ABC transporter permease [Blastocatellia bacterium]|nr:ABC transporter permease [Blastocatellia bacterium]